MNTIKQFIKVYVTYRIVRTKLWLIVVCTYLYFIIYNNIVHKIVSTATEIAMDK